MQGVGQGEEQSPFPFTLNRPNTPHTVSLLRFGVPAMRIGKWLLYSIISLLVLCVIASAYRRHKMEKRAAGFSEISALKKVTLKMKKTTCSELVFCNFLTFFEQ